MKNREKIKESISYTFKRTIITATIIAIILYFLHLFPIGGKSKLTMLEMIWSIAFCILFVGHWLELLFVNYIKFALPESILVIYFLRISYWFLCAIPIVFLVNLICNLFSHKTGQLVNWWEFGLSYIGIQLLMHLIMHLRFKKSFYNGVYWFFNFRYKILIFKTLFVFYF